MLERFFPDERKFFAKFSYLAQRLTSAATLLEQALDQPERLAELSASIDRVELETDAAALDLDQNVDRVFIPPMDVEDIHLLSVRLRRTVDLVGGVARQALSLKATERRETAVTLAHLLVTAAREIEGAIADIRSSDAVMAHCRVVKQMEEEGDAVWEAAMTALFNDQADPVEVLRWKSVYDPLEDALDACDDVANELETIAVKHE
jgi:uncharacterized protein